MARLPDLRKKITLVVLGRSGSGKGTQAAFLVRHLGPRKVAHMETGRFLREFIKRDNVTAAIGRKNMGSGNLLPSWYAAFGWLKELIEKGEGEKHLVYDGAPRRVWEARLIDEVMRWHGRPEAICIYIDVPERVAVERMLLRKRIDDHMRAIKNRMKFFRKDILPVIAYYRKYGRLIHIDGMPSSSEVSRAIEDALSRRLKSTWPRR